MPINNDLPDHPLLVNLKTGKASKTEYINGLEAINVRILNAPSINDLMNYIPEFTSGTWEDNPVINFTNEEREKAVEDLFEGYLLPTALETIKITFIVENLDLPDVCHLIRHRTMGFSASGTGDRDSRFDKVLLKPSMIGSKYEGRIRYHINALKELYAEMMDDEEIPILDPRTILPRNTNNYYYVTADLKAIMAFVGQRRDESIEPETMNIFAFKLWREICKIYPKLKYKINLRDTDHFAVKTSIGGRSSNFYVPEEKNDIYEYKLSWFMRKKKRSEMRNGDQYIKLRDSILKEIDDL